MSEWWTYALSDFLLFSPRTYYRLFELYNAAVWPGQVPALALGGALAALPVLRVSWGGRMAAAILAVCWLWVAWGYLYTRYATINWAAEYMAMAFVGQALLLVAIGVLGGRLRFGQRPWVGIAFVLFAVAVQPLIGPLAGRTWAQVELFALAPDPTAVATLGVLLAAQRVRWELFVLPLAWCAVGGATLWTMEAPDAWVLPAAGGLALTVALARAVTGPRSCAAVESRGSPDRG
ncbi:DUF6064 family protein [Azospirillum sp.]|uniref:DUF6064 family protein n=1 Tax=Azospirillum sp. TaxID=34012 RepID=UPI002D350C47|nr:DUF6064 family protein [Azospirillum sp.]HYD71152.1 DUF6064 family protein [Azospirillum sp.]